MRKRGIVTEFPWKLYGETINISTTHTWMAVAHGDVWAEFVDGSYIDGSTEACLGYGERSRFFLTTYGSTAMIQTGHSQGDSAGNDREHASLLEATHNSKLFV